MLASETSETSETSEKALCRRPIDQLTRAHGDAARSCTSPQRPREATYKIAINLSTIECRIN